MIQIDNHGQNCRCGLSDARLQSDVGVVVGRALLIEVLIDALIDHLINELVARLLFGA